MASSNFSKPVHVHSAKKIVMEMLASIEW